ncbi:MAG: TonB-dependent receptor domain-containing protein, partial [Pyrinomonadaceae bacterium]
DAQAEVGAGTTRLSVNGARLDFNAYFLDGTETSDAFGNSPGGLGGGFLGVDALREFEVLTSNYSAEYGQGGGAIFNAITKSGTNELHGTAFEFLRNSALDARNFFNAGKLPFQRNQFGGSLGGPIRRNSTFIFGSYEGLRRREGTSTLFTVPSEDARRGLLVSNPANPCANKRQVTVNPAVVPYVALFPSTTAPTCLDTGIYRRDFKESTNEDFFTVRVDLKLTGKHSMFGRYSIDDSDLLAVNTNSGVIQEQVLVNRNQYVSLEGVSVFTPTAVNTVRLGYNRSNFSSDFPFSVPVPESLAFIPGRPMGATVLSGLSDLRPALTVARKFVLNTYEVSDQLVHTRGNHSFKFGGMARRYQLNANSPLVSDGAYLFGGGVEGLLQGGTLLLLPQPGTDFYRAIRQTLFGFYVQDDWKVRRNLTLNLGLRYEPYTTPTEANDRVANFRSFTDRTSVVGDPYIENPSYNNFGPRVGFAYDPSGAGRWAIRGAFGVFYSAILPMRYRFQISAVPPFANLVAIPGFALPPPCRFPNSFRNCPNVNINLGLLWLTEFEAEQPTVYQWNLNVQREISKDLVVQAGYVGSRGVHLETGYTSNIRSDFMIVNGQKFFPPGSGTRINPAFGAIQRLNFNGDSYYHGLQLTATKRYAAGLQFQAAYTFSKSIDTNSAIDSVFTNGSVGSDAQDPFDTSLEKGPSDFDVRHNFVANLLYDLPFGKDLTGAAGKLLGGWSVGGILNLRSGFPFHVHLGQGFDRARNGVDNTRSQRPNVTPGRTYESAITGNPNRFVDPTAFQLQPAGFYGNEGRNVLTGPDLKVFDLSVIKKTALTERVRIEFRTEVFNLTNHTNFAAPEPNNRAIFVGVDANGNGIIPDTFGQLTKTATSS